MAKPTATAEAKLIDQPTAYKYIGLSKAKWFQLRSAGGLPNPVYLKGSSRPFWRRSDLDKWLAALPGGD